MALLFLWFRVWEAYHSGRQHRILPEQVGDKRNCRFFFFALVFVCDISFQVRTRLETFRLDLMLETRLLGLLAEARPLVPRVAFLLVRLSAFQSPLVDLQEALLEVFLGTQSPQMNGAETINVARSSQHRPLEQQVEIVLFCGVEVLFFVYTRCSPQFCAQRWQALVLAARLVSRSRLSSCRFGASSCGNEPSSRG